MKKAAFKINFDQTALSERAEVLRQIIAMINALPDTKKLPDRRYAIATSHLHVPDLYYLLSSMKMARNPRSYFWWAIKAQK